MIPKKETENREMSARRFYTPTGWAGTNYDPNLTITDIAKAIRKYAKAVHPDYKFSVTTKSYSGGSTLNVTLLEGAQEAFQNPDDRGYKQIYTSDLAGQNQELTEPVRLVMADMSSCVNSYRMDDSDSMTDYFDTNFYYHLNVGNYDRPYKVTKPKRKYIRQTANSEIAASYSTENRFTISEQTEKAIYSHHPLAVKNMEPTIEQSNQEVAPINYKGYQLTVTPDTDTRDNKQIWVVKATKELSREQYLNLYGYIKDLGGYYSKYKHGFIFSIQDPTDLLKETETAVKHSDKADSEPEKALQTHTVCIYQLKPECSEVLFIGWDNLQNHGGFQPENYNKIWEGELKQEEQGSFLEEIYTRFNINHPTDFTGHSLSPSDVVSVDGNAYFVDKIAFKPVQMEAPVMEFEAAPVMGFSM